MTGLNHLNEFSSPGAAVESRLLRWRQGPKMADPERKAAGKTLLEIERHPLRHRGLVLAQVRRRLRNSTTCTTRRSVSGNPLDTLERLRPNKVNPNPVTLTLIP